MRKVLLIVLGAATSLALVFRYTPLRYYVVPPKLTPTQRAILDRAQAGLTVYATNSPTARGFLHDANRYARWSVFVPGVGVFDADSNQARPLAVAVHPHDVATTIASYAHEPDRILFVEPKCSLMSHVTLGLIFAHELQHRRDYFQRVYTSDDSARSRSRMMTELNARRAVLRILSEFTDGRWDSVVTLHNDQYRRFSRASRREHPFGKITLVSDRRWIAQEFGRLAPPDSDYLNSMIQFDGALRLSLPDSAISAQDTTEAYLGLMRQF